MIFIQNMNHNFNSYKIIHLSIPCGSSIINDKIPDLHFDTVNFVPSSKFSFISEPCLPHALSGRVVLVTLLPHKAPIDLPPLSSTLTVRRQQRHEIRSNNHQSKQDYLYQEHWMLGHGV